MTHTVQWHTTQPWRKDNSQRAITHGVKFHIHRSKCEVWLYLDYEPCLCPVPCEHNSNVLLWVQSGSQPSLSSWLDLTMTHWTPIWRQSLLVLPIRRGDPHHDIGLTTWWLTFLVCQTQELIVIAQSISFEVIPGITLELRSGVELRTGPLWVEPLAKHHGSWKTLENHLIFKRWFLRHLELI